MVRRNALLFILLCLSACGPTGAGGASSGTHELTDDLARAQGDCGDDHDGGSPGDAIDAGSPTFVVDAGTTAIDAGSAPGACGNLTWGENQISRSPLRRGGAAAGRTGP